MLCLRCSRGIAAATRSSNPWQGVQKSLVQQSTMRYVNLLREVLCSNRPPRTFTSFRGLSRPCLLPESATLRPSPGSTTSLATASSSGILSLLPNLSTARSFSSTPALGAPRDTFDPSHFVRKRRHGFLSRIRTRKGRALLKRRKAKRRSTLSH